MRTTLEKTVREIAVKNAASMRVLETLGIDYCCGGNKPLSEALANAHVDPLDALQLLELAGSLPTANEVDWQCESLDRLIAHIVASHHGYVRRETRRIHALLSKVQAKHTAAHPEVAEIAELFTAMGQELALHMLKEEQILFPQITQVEQFGSGVRLHRPISQMVADHEDAGEVLARIRALSNDYVAPEGACPTLLALWAGLQDFERDLHRHVHLENNILFPRAIALEQL